MSIFAKLKAHQKLVGEIDHLHGSLEVLEQEIADAQDKQGELFGELADMVAVGSARAVMAGGQLYILEHQPGQFNVRLSEVEWEPHA